MPRRTMSKVTLRLWSDDLETLRRNFPGHQYGELGINEVTRSIIHEWVMKNLETDDDKSPRIDQPIFDRGTL